MQWALPLILAAQLLGHPKEFERDFTGRTLRLDTWHSGTSKVEGVSLDRWRLEGPWPGNRTNLVDRRGLGKYRYLVRDAESRALLFSRGYCSIFGEYETTGPALVGTWGTFHESVRMPEPRRKVEVSIEKRNRQGAFEPLWSTVVGPGSIDIDRARLQAGGVVTKLAGNGPPATRVDLLLLGDGYTASQGDLFLADCRRMSEALFAQEPFKSRRAEFSVRSLLVPSVEPGISDPRGGVWRSNPLGTSFNSLKLDRYVLTERNRALREAAAAVPYDFVIILCNSDKYGGGGIFNLYATCTVHAKHAAYVFVHEFGHSFAGFADEYYSSKVAYEDLGEADVEPWETNVTRLMDPKRLKWRSLVLPDTPLPTPWDQAGYDALAASFDLRIAKARTVEGMDQKLLQEEKLVALRRFLESQKYFGRVGAFEGAGYAAKGLFRSELNCIMFSKHAMGFSRVARAAISASIDLEAR